MNHPFIAGAQAMRELQARTMQKSGDPVTANLMRQNWHEAWGQDPGTPEADPQDMSPEDFAGSSEWGPANPELGTL